MVNGYSNEPATASAYKITKTAMYFDQLLRYYTKHIHINPEEFNPIYNAYEVKEFNRKHQLTREGDIENNIYFVVKGIARKFFKRGKEEVNTQFAREGQTICATVSFYSRKPSDFTIETIEPVTCLAISYDQLQDHFTRFPKMEKLGRLLMTGYYVQHEQRELNRLKYTTEERFIRLMNERPDLVQRVPQKYLASYLDITPETFSRMKHLLYKK
jgi:CRP-like cAMP-binding protein